MNLKSPVPADGKEMHVVVEFNSFKVSIKGFAYCYLAGIPLRCLHRAARRHREEDSYFGKYRRIFLTRGRGRQPKNE